MPADSPPVSPFRTRRARAAFFLFGLFAFLPGLALGALVLKFGVAVPFWDEWDRPARELIKYERGELGFSDLFEQHNEARDILPTIYFIALAQIGGWNVKTEMLGTFLLACLISLGIYRLSANTLGLSRTRLLVLWGFVNLLIFCPMQWTNWLWGIQIITFVPAACLVGILLFFQSRHGIVAKFLLCVVLSVTATFSYSNGMLVWIITLPVLLYHVSRERRPKWWILAGWLAAFVTAIAVYFWDYQKPGGHPAFTEAFADPLTAGAFFLSFLGSPLAGGRQGVAIAVGLVFLGLFVLTTLLWARSCYREHRCAVDGKGQDGYRHLLDEATPWLCLGGYALLSGLSTTVGRVGFGVSQALAWRYVTFSVCLPVALIYFAAAVRSGPSLGRSRKAALTILYLVVGVTSLPLYAASYAMSVRFMETTHRARLYARACVMLLDSLQSDDCLQEVPLHPNANVVRERGRFLSSRGVLRPLLIGEKDARRIRGPGQPDGAHVGFIDLASAERDGTYGLAGWAVLSHRRRTADAVVITYRMCDGTEKMAQLVRTGRMREDVASVMGDGTFQEAGWAGELEIESIPGSAVAIGAWAFDAERGEAFRLANEHPLEGRECP